MQTKNIEKLKAIQTLREDPNGYFKNKKSVRIASKNLRKVTVAGPYDNVKFDEFIIQAILEKEKKLLKRAFELEEINYQNTKKLAKIEAANLLAGEEIIKPQTT